MGGIATTIMIRNIFRLQINSFQPFTGMLVPFGRSEGVGLFNGFHIPSFIGTRLKYATLFTEKYWGMTGLKEPK